MNSKSGHGDWAMAVIENLLSEMMDIKNWIRFSTRVPT